MSCRSDRRSGRIGRRAQANLRNLLRSASPPHAPQFRQAASDTSTEVSISTCGAGKPGHSFDALYFCHPRAV